MATCIRIHLEDQLDAGRSAPAAEFNLADFGGQLPQVGDVIAAPPVEGEPPEAWDVLARYHEPGDPYDAGACIRIVARRRPVNAGEGVLLGLPQLEPQAERV
jgi:hypothetical protein